MFWLFFTLLVLLLACIGDEKYVKVKSVNTIARILLVLVLSYAIALCSNGSDRHEYLFYFRNIETIATFRDLSSLVSMQSHMEIGYVLLAKVCMLLGFSDVGVLFVTSIITNTLFVSVFFKYKYPYFVAFLFILSTAFQQEANLYRQMLAVAIGMYSIKYITERNLTKYLLFVFLAFLIHRSSLLLLLFIPFIYIQERHYNITKKTLLVLWILSFGFYFHIFPEFTYLGLFMEDTWYEHYASLEQGLGSEVETLNVIYILFVIFLFIFGKKPKNQITAVYFVLGSAFYNASFGAQYFSRMALYFYPMFCAYLPSLITENRLMKGKSLFDETIVLGVLFMYYLRRLYIDRITSDYDVIGDHIGSIIEIFR